MTNRAHEERSLDSLRTARFGITRAVGADGEAEVKTRCVRQRAKEKGILRCARFGMTPQKKMQIPRHGRKERDRLGMTRAIGGDGEAEVRRAACEKLQEREWRHGGGRERQDGGRKPAATFVRRGMAPRGTERQGQERFFAALRMTAKNKRQNYTVAGGAARLLGAYTVHILAAGENSHGNQHSDRGRRAAGAG